MIITGFRQQLIGQSLSQRGKDFWLLKHPSYTKTFLIFDLSTAQEAATVVISVVSENNSWEKTYQVPANSTLVTDAMPDWVEIDALAQKSTRSVHVHSSAPIACYAHFYGNAYSAGALLMAEETWGYRYTGVTAPGGKDAFVCVLASKDNTKVEITPAAATETGNAAGAPFTVVLNKGQVYKVWPANSRDDLSGTVVKSVPNSYGACIPSAVYFGAMGTPICRESYSSDFLIQQMPPEQTWGKKYFTTPFSTTKSATLLNKAIFRVMVKDPATVVKRNGVQLTGLVNNLFYQFESNTADYIEGSNPVMVTQFMKSQECNDYGDGDPEMIVLSPIEQAVNRVDFHNSYMLEIQINYLSLTIPTEGLKTLTINGSNTFTATYPHPYNPAYTVVVRRWVASDEAVTVKSDSAFTAISYGLGPFESYAFNLIPLQSLVALIRLQEQGEQLLKEAICNSRSFKPVLKTEYLPTKIEWHLKNINGLTPNDADVVINSPLPDSAVQENGRLYHIYGLPGYYAFTKPGIYAVTVTITTPAIDNCSNTQTFTGYWQSKATPVADFSTAYKGCLPIDINFTAGATGDTSTLTGWHWNFGDAQSTLANPVYSTTVTGAKAVYLQVKAANGCTADTTKTISVAEATKPVAAFQLPEKVCLPYGAAGFTNKSVYSGTAGTVNWLWKFDDGATATTKDATHYYTEDKSYNVSLIVTAPDGCADTSVEVMDAFSVRPRAAFNMSATAICVNDSVSFTDASVAASGTVIATRKWQLGGGVNSTLAQVQKIYKSPGSYTISLFVTSNEGCVSDTAEKILEVYDVPRVDAGGDKTLIQGAAVRLDGSVGASGAVTVQWSPPATLSNAAITTPLALPEEDQRYYLSAVTGGGCSAQDSVLVKVLPSLVVPNAFTPNGDGNHDVWDIPGLNSYQSCTVQVFNRWGQKVFDSKGYATPWNGSVKGKGEQVPAGVYYYIINPAQGMARLTGAVMLLR